MKIAAVWARVSTQDQRELSLKGQVERCRTKLESLGYLVPPERILAVDWTSLDLYACPQFRELRRWVKAGEITALGVLDRDRLNAQGLQRLNLLADCKEAGVELIPYQGPPMLEGPEGQLVELALAIGKERSVERAQQGARDGLRDRARLKGLPPAPKNPYGYAWNSTRTKLQATSELPNAEFICRAALEGVPIRRISQELHRRGTSSPSGKTWWPSPTIYGILTNPIYGGRFYALRREMVLPRHRRTQSYGKSSGRHKPIEEAFLLPNIMVECPPLTWDEWLALQGRLKVNKLQAQRNARRDYLLRSLIICETHRRRYRGSVHCGKWRYQCPTCYDQAGSPCPRPYLFGPELEEKVKAICRQVLSSPEVLEQEIRQRAGRVEATLESLQNSLATLDRRGARNRDMEANLLLERAKGNASPEAYERCLAMLKAERVWIAEERQRLQAQLDTARQGEATLFALAQVREKLATKLDSAANEDWRLIFSALALELHVTEQGNVEVALALPVEKPSIVSSAPLSASGPWPGSSAATGRGGFLRA
ncbi:MAG: recombinase family protein [Chloroflexi bacterium]|nr:recombinase family protein [Chloroflexota bacterium]